MPSTQKSKARPAARPRASAATRARFEKNHRAVGRLAKSLDSAQKDLSSIGGSVGTGASDLRKDVAKRLREARKDVTKMGNTLRRDLERLQGKNSGSAAKKAKPKKAKARRAKTAKPRAKATTRAKAGTARAKSTRAKSSTTRAKSARAKSAAKSRARRKSA
jgi:hypothetical protein